MQNDKEYIYALYFDDFTSSQHLQEGPDEVIFYIGRTTNPEHRIKQHRYEAKKGKEDKYIFIRELENKNIEWDLKVLRAVDISDVRPWEYWYVIESIRKGAPLKNMRYGDFQRVSDSRLKNLVDDDSVRSVDDLKTLIAKKENQENYKSSESVQMRAILQSLRWLRTESEERNGQIAKWNIYDLGEGTEEIKAEFTMKKKELATLLTPASKEAFRKIERMIAQQGASADAKKRRG